MSSSSPFKFCPHCGAEVDAAVETCPKCGTKMGPAPPLPTPKRRNVWVAVVASVIFPGLGQAYNGQTSKAVGFIIIGAVLVFSILLLVGVILYPLFWAYSVYDAYNTAKRIDAGIKPG